MAKLDLKKGPSRGIKKSGSTIPHLDSTYALDPTNTTGWLLISTKEFSIPFLHPQRFISFPVVGSFFFPFALKMPTKMGEKTLNPLQPIESMLKCESVLQ